MIDRKTDEINHELRSECIYREKEKESSKICKLIRLQMKANQDEVK